MADEYIDKVEVGAKIQIMYIRREMDYGGENDFCRGMRKALQVIKNMPAADVQPVDRWISVKDRLPENYVEVMLYDADCGIVLGWYDSEIEDFAAEFISPLDAVTHWQPLPEPPTNKI